MGVQRGRSERGTIVGGALLALVWAGLVTASSAGAQAVASADTRVVDRDDVTFTRDVARILQDNCVSCHRAGGGAPMSLETYQMVRRYAARIRDRTGLRDRPGAMPPWYVEKDIGIQHYENDMSLSDEEVATIAAWVDNGAPEGDPADMPPLREFDDYGEWAIRPDLVVQSSEIVVSGDSPDWWGDIEPIEIPLEEDRYVAAVQVREINDVPIDGARETVGSRWVIHHLVYRTVVPENEQLDQDQDQAQGRRVGWPVHEVGRNEDIFDPGAGRLLKAGSQIESESLHLHANGLDTRARLEFAFEFHPKDYKPEYTLSGGSPGGNTVDMDILPNEADQALEAYGVLDRHTKLISFEPHLHAPGVRMCLEAIWGSKAETLSCVGYDHSWVRTYTFAENYRPLLPKGTILKITGWMDNTDANPNVSHPENWMGGGNRSVANMFLELGMSVGLTDEQFLAEMEARREALGLNLNDYVIGCPLCGATLPSTLPKPADMMRVSDAAPAGGGQD